jgi:hypothetical protein
LEGGQAGRYAVSSVQERVHTLSLSAVHMQALDSFTGRLDPRLALLSRELVEHNVVHRVLRWAGLGRGDGGSAEAHLNAMLAEDAAEVRC